jgi:hypothetical protein
MEDINEFIEQYRPNLLLYLDANTMRSPEQSGPLEFVEEVIDSWYKFAEGRVLREPSLQERTFWFALYQLEDLVEFPATDQLHPYEAILMQNLAEVRELLRDRGKLPDEFFASRPGEEPGAL